MEAEQIERQHKECERQERERQDAHEICQERDLESGAESLAERHGCRKCKSST